jgi:hypothetical protein
MSKLLPLKITDVDVTRLAPQADPTTLSNGGKMIWINYHYPSGTQAKLDVVSPVVKSAFGLNDYNGNQKFSITFSYWGLEEKDSVIKKLYDLDLALDNWLLDYASANWERWFKKKVPRDVLAFNMKRLVKDSKNPGEYPPQGKVQANPNPGGDFMFKAFDANTKQPVVLNASNANQVIPKGTKVQLVMSYSGAWISGTGGFGWWRKIKQLLYYPDNSVMEELVLDGFGETPVEDIE